MARAADPLLARSAAASIVARLRDAGHTAYFAGGCVRDELLGLAPTDYDVATDATPDRVASLFDRTMLVGVAFGVVLVQIPPSPSAPSLINVEVATFRSDGPYSDARRPDRIHFSDPAADAQRRDFTINALFLDPLVPPPSPIAPLHPAPDVVATSIRGRIIDYVGGVNDLRARLVRAVGDPDQRLAEDHLRALRAVRFAARLGFEIDPATSQAISRHAAELRGVSRERIGEEIRRMLLHPTRAAAADLLQSLQLDAPVLDGPHVQASLATLAKLQMSPDPSPPSYPVCLAAWALDRADALPLPAAPTPLAAPLPHSRRARSAAEGLIGRWRSALRLSNEERDELAAILNGYALMTSTWGTSGDAPQRRMAVRPWFGGALRLLRVRKPGLAAEIESRVAELRDTPPGLAPEPFITGDDLLQIGIPASPRFKQVLDAVYDAQLEGRVRSKSEARELAKDLCV